MQNTLYKGTWAARFPKSGSGVPLTKAHYIESDIAGRAVTHCGREMVYSTDKGKLVSADWVARCVECPTGL